MSHSELAILVNLVVLVNLVLLRYRMILVILLNWVFWQFFSDIVGGNGNSDGNVDSSISGNSVEFSNSCE